MIEIKGKSKAKILATLYNNARVQGMGWLHYDPTPMTESQAQELLDGGNTYFDYLKGRVMKVDLSGDYMETWLYNRDNGKGKAEKLIDALTSTTQAIDGPEEP